MSKAEGSGRGRSGKQSPAEPRNWEEVNQRLAYLGEAERQIRALRDQFEQKVAVLKQQWLEASQPVEQERDRLREQIERFYWGHRGELLAEGRKSVELAFGRLGSRLSRSVAVEDAVAAQQWLEAHSLARFLRTRTEVDREAIRSALLASNGSGEFLSRALLACPAIQFQETEQFWYEVTRPALRSLGSGGPTAQGLGTVGRAGARANPRVGRGPGRVAGASNSSRRPVREAAPEHVVSETISSGGCHDRAVH